MRNRGLLANRSRLVAAVLVVLLVLTGIAAVLTVLAEPVSPGPGSQGFRTGHPGITRLLAAAQVAGDQVEETIEASRFQGVASLDDLPSANRVRALERSGLEVRPLGHLPLAFVAGTPAQLLDAVTGGAARDVWPNERLEYLSAESNTAMGIDPLRAEGLTGKGVGVAIVDNGVDATHPDLADHVTHNFKVVSGDYLGDPIGALIPPVVIPFDDLPYGNTDLTTGHGTHVAGIVAADGHTSPDQVGVAP
ncbi:MAG: S8 family serine peptidase, partial [Actinomycetota bacterium]